MGHPGPNFGCQILDLAYPGFVASLDSVILISSSILSSMFYCPSYVLGAFYTRVGVQKNPKIEHLIGHEFKFELKDFTLVSGTKKLIQVSE